MYYPYTVLHVIWNYYLWPTKSEILDLFQLD